MIKNVTQGKKAQILIRFHNANKTNNYNREGKRGGKIQKNLQNKSKHKNNSKCFSWVTAVRVVSLSGSHSPPHLPRMPSNTALISGPAVGASHILVWSHSCVFLSSMSTAIRTSAFSFVGALNNLVYIPQRVCLVDHVDLACSLYSWWEGFGSSSLDALPLGFNCGFISTSACGHPLEFAPEAALKNLGLPLWGEVWRWCSFLSSRGSGSISYSGELVARTARNIVL